MPVSLNEFKKNSLQMIQRFVPSASILMGFVVLLYGTLSYYSRCMEADSTELVVPYIALIMCSVFGILILIDMKHSINRAVGLYAMAISIDRIARYIPSLDPPHGIIFVFGLVMIGFAVNLCVTGFFFLNKIARAQPGMFIGTTILLLLNIASILYMLFMPTDPFTIEEIFLIYPDTIALMFVYILLLCMLNSEHIRNMTVNEKNATLLDSLRRMMTCDEQSFVTRETAEVLKNALTDRSKWTKLNEGPAESEYHFSIYHSMGDRSFVTVQKWKERDEIFFTISDHEGGSLLNAYRFNVDTITADYDAQTGRSFLSMFNQDGLFIRLTVREVTSVES